MESISVLDEFPKIKQPGYQAIAVFMLASFVILFEAVLSGIGLQITSERFPYLCAASFLFLFAMFNSIISFSSTNSNKYISWSITAFVVLMFALALVAQAFTGASIGEVGSYRWIFLVLTISHLTFLSITGAIRFIADFFRKRDDYMNRK